MAGDIRDLVSYRLARLAGLNDRSGHVHLTETFGLTLGEWRVLGSIAAHAPVTLAGLSRAMLVDKGQLSRMAAALIERGWVRDTPSKTDRRTATLALTAAGKREHDRILAFATDRNRAVLSVLEPAEQRDFMRLVGKLTVFVEAEHAALARGSARAAEISAKDAATRSIP